MKLGETNIETTVYSIHFFRLLSLSHMHVRLIHSFCGLIVHFSLPSRESPAGPVAFPQDLMSLEGPGASSLGASPAGRLPPLVPHLSIPAPLPASTFDN